MLKTFSITDIGKRRKLNQDYVYTSEMPIGNLPNVFIVADVMQFVQGIQFYLKEKFPNRLIW